MKSVLLINEDPRFHKAVLRALDGDGYRVWWTPNTESVVDLLGELPVDLVIADYSTPQPGEQNVIEVVQRIKPRPRLVLTIAHGTPDTVLKALRARVCDFLIRPFKPEELRRVIDSAISGCPAQAIEVISAQPEWVELRVPCDRAAFSTLQRLLDELDAVLFAPRLRCRGLLYNPRLQTSSAGDQASHDEWSCLRFFVLPAPARRHASCN